MSDELNEELDPIIEAVDSTEEAPTEESVAETDKPEVDLEEQNRKLYARAKKAEAELKELKSKQAEKPINQTNTDFLSREEGILIAQGMDADDLDELKVVAQAKGLSLLKAKETPLFQGYLDHKAKELKKERAKLPASKGSGQSQEKSISDLSKEEHQALVREMMAKAK